MEKILVIDNYDSFTYNLVYYLTIITGRKPEVYRNDKITIAEAERFDRIVLSPGPGIPDEAGICKSLIRRYAPEKPILGICLGHQAIAEVFGATLKNLQEVYHGIRSRVHVTDPEEVLFRGLPETLEAGRYHSWAVRNHPCPDDLIITCKDENGMIMGIRHKIHPVKGLQFHPESILTTNGLEIIKNWIDHG